MMGECLRTFHVASLMRLKLLRPQHLLTLPTRLVPRQQTLALLGVLDVQPSQLRLVGDGVECVVSAFGGRVGLGLPVPRTERILRPDASLIRSTNFPQHGDEKGFGGD